MSEESVKVEPKPLDPSDIPETEIEKVFASAEELFGKVVTDGDSD